MFKTNIVSVRSQSIVYESMYFKVLEWKESEGGHAAEVAADTEEEVVFCWPVLFFCSTVRATAVQETEYNMMAFGS